MSGDGKRSDAEWPKLPRPSSTLPSLRSRRCKILDAIRAIADIGPGSPASMPLGNMRVNGGRSLAAWCLGRGCNHFRVLDVSGYPDDVPVPSFGTRLRWKRCENVR